MNLQDVNNKIRFERDQLAWAGLTDDFRHFWVSGKFGGKSLMLQLTQITRLVKEEARSLITR